MFTRIFYFLLIVKGGEKIQKNKNQKNKFMILAMAFVIFSIAIVGSIDGVSSAYVDTSYTGQWVPNNYVSSQNSYGNYDSKS